MLDLNFCNNWIIEGLYVGKVGLMFVLFFSCWNFWNEYIDVFININVFNGCMGLFFVFVSMFWYIWCNMFFYVKLYVICVKFIYLVLVFLNWFGWYFNIYWIFKRIWIEEDLLLCWKIFILYLWINVCGINFINVRM